MVDRGVALLAHNTNPGPRTGVVYEVKIEAKHVTNVKVNARGAAGKPVWTNEQVMQWLSQNPIYYTGKATGPGATGWGERALFKRRYRKSGGEFKWTVRVPGTQNTVEVYVPFSEENVKFSSLFYGDGKTGSVINGKFYDQVELQVRGAELKNYLKHSTPRPELGLPHGAAANIYQPTSKEPLRAKILDVIAKLPDCFGI